MQEEIVINPLNEKIEEALNKIRPYLEADGGNVQVIELTEDLVLRVKFMGACSSCSMSAMTFKGGIEDTIRREVPEIVKVEVVA
jgi:Fe-S cluster biogenesis protein NfuA